MVDNYFYLLILPFLEAQNNFRLLLFMNHIISELCILNVPGYEIFRLVNKIFVKILYSLFVPLLLFISIEKQKKV